ncbi:hypothetical protein E2C01_091380 [Portunus trituberculatus]|uniref:Uncharacterized protein n=1 Tax=Portunus trituberculatus TaxID=210409 RepID=A0A5B7JMT4_PORTR|nr:hypothetical protein [Portunus trituberculatus]
MKEINVQKVEFWVCFYTTLGRVGVTAAVHRGFTAAADTTRSAPGVGVREGKEELYEEARDSEPLQTTRLRSPSWLTAENLVVDEYGEGTAVRWSESRLAAPASSTG